MKKSTTLLKEGVNIASILATSDLKGRFSEYHVQTLPITAPEVGQPLPDEGVVIKDPEIRYRPLTIIADGVLWDRQLMKSRANWEACVRKARGNSLVTTLAGWTQEDGSLWDLNCTTQVVSPWLSIDNKTYLTSSLHFQMDDKSGKRTELELEPLDAYLLDPTLRDKESAFSLLTEKESYG
jgi:prophage tail gpP-like protein